MCQERASYLVINRSICPLWAAVWMLDRMLGISFYISAWTDGNSSPTLVHLRKLPPAATYIHYCCISCVDSACHEPQKLLALSWHLHGSATCRRRSLCMHVTEPCECQDKFACLPALLLAFLIIYCWHLFVSYDAFTTHAAHTSSSTCMQAGSNQLSNPSYIFICRSELTFLASWVPTFQARGM